MALLLLPLIRRQEKEMEILEEAIWGPPSPPVVDPFGETAAGIPPPLPKKTFIPRAVPVGWLTDPAATRRLGRKEVDPQELV